MTRKILGIVLAVSLVLSLATVVVAGGLEGYSLRGAEEGFKPRPVAKPNSSVVFADAVIGKPVGFVATVTGTALFVVTLPFTLPSGDVGTAARGLVTDPGGWTFVRPLGRSDPRFEDIGVFSGYGE